MQSNQREIKRNSIATFILWGLAGIVLTACNAWGDISYSDFLADFELLGQDPILSNNARLYDSTEKDLLLSDYVDLWEERSVQSEWGTRSYYVELTCADTITYQDYVVVGSEAQNIVSEGDVSPTFSGGDSDLWEVSETLYVGKDAYGSLVIRNGAQVTDPNAFIGYDKTSTGLVQVTGGGSQWIHSDGTSDQALASSLFVGGYG